MSNIPVDGQDTAFRIRASCMALGGSYADPCPTAGSRTAGMTNRVGPFNLFSLRRPDTSYDHQQDQLLCAMYRLYRMESPTGEIQGFEDFEADSDDVAIELALREAGEQRIELWRAGKKIAAISGANEPVELMITPPAE